MIETEKQLSPRLKSRTTSNLKRSKKKTNNSSKNNKKKPEIKIFLPRLYERNNYADKSHPSNEADPQPKQSWHPQAQPVASVSASDTAVFGIVAVAADNTPRTDAAAVGTSSSAAASSPWQLPDTA